MSTRLHSALHRPDRLLRLLLHGGGVQPHRDRRNLKKHGGFIPGVRPGERTGEHIDYVLTRIAVVGTAYLALVCLLPDTLITYAAVPFYFGGTSPLIVVSIIMDAVAQTAARARPLIIRAENRRPI